MTVGELETPFLLVAHLVTVSEEGERGEGEQGEEKKEKRRR